MQRIRATRIVRIDITRSRRARTIQVLQEFNWHHIHVSSIEKWPDRPLL